MSDLRFYTFVNFYLSSIQQGVQSFHVCHEMFMKYKNVTRVSPTSFEVEPSLEANRLFDWASHYKTMICLNGGANQDIMEKYLFFSREACTFGFPAPFESFSEDEYSLGGVMTAVGIVLPEEIYDAVNHRAACLSVSSEKFKEGKIDNLSDTEAFYFIKDGAIMELYTKDTPQWRLITMLKACPLAR